MTGLLDLGNSRMKWAELVDGEPDQIERVAYANEGRVRWLADWLRGKASRRRVLIGSVLGREFEQQLCAELSGQADPVLEFVRPTDGVMGISLGYLDPARLGVDRFLGLVAAKATWNGAPLVVVDCGSAITIAVTGRMYQQVARK